VIDVSSLSMVLDTVDEGETCPVLVLTPCRLGNFYSKLYPDTRPQLTAVKIQFGYVDGPDLGKEPVYESVETVMGKTTDVRVLSGSIFSMRALTHCVTKKKTAAASRAMPPPPPRPVSRSSSMSSMPMAEEIPDTDMMTFSRPIKHKFANAVVQYGPPYPVFCSLDYHKTKHGEEMKVQQIATFAVDRCDGYYTPLQPKGVEQRDDHTRFLNIKLSCGQQSYSLIWRVGAYNTMADINQVLREVSPELSVFDISPAKCTQFEVALLAMRPEGEPQHVPSAWGENSNYLVYDNNFSVNLSMLDSPQFVFRTEDTELCVPSSMKRSNGPLATVQRPPTCGCPTFSVVDGVIITHKYLSCLRLMLECIARCCHMPSTQRVPA